MTQIEVKLKDGKVSLKEGMMLYCPSHGPGKVVCIEEKQVLGEKSVFCKIEFQQYGFGDVLSIFIPIDKMKSMGIRTIVSAKTCEKIVTDVLKKHVRSNKGIWSSRIQEYESKLYSGLTPLVAEVVRDLFVCLTDPTKSYGERIIFDKAFNWLVQEFSLAMNISIEEANKMIIDAVESNIVLPKYDDFEESNDAQDVKDDFDDEDDEDNEDDNVKKIA